MASEMLISIDSLRLRAPIGVGEQERIVGGDFEVSVSFSYPPALDAALTDSLALTANYAEVVELVRKVLSDPMMLIETACGRIRSELLRAFPLIGPGEVTVAKLLPPIPGVQLRKVSATLRW